MLDIDLDTFIIIVYEFVSNWYEEAKEDMRVKRGRPAKFSDGEALSLAIISEWRAGVPWQSERGFMRYMHKHYGSWFPHLPQYSAFNERKRRLWGTMLLLQETLCEQLSDAQDVYEAVDCLPMPAGSIGQYTREKGHWLWESTVGKGKSGWFWGDHLLASLRPSGVVSGWLLAAAHINDRWIMEAFLSTRQSHPQLIGPPQHSHTRKKDYVFPPIGFIGAFAAVGQSSPRPYLVDKGFNGYRWRLHWAKHYQAQVISVPPPNSKREQPWTRSMKKWLASHRQVVETVFSILEESFKIKRLRAHSRWGQYTRITAKIIGYHLGLWINRLFNRPPFSHETLLC